MIHAIIAVEDKRFWTDPGVDLRGVARAVLSDITGGATEGASTIAEQFVKNTLGEENNRTVFEKLREAALAFQLTHRWRKTKILTEYLNSIYFGNGAYGVESAARVYFGKALGYDPNAPSDGHTSRCGDSTQHQTLASCASLLDPAAGGAAGRDGGQPAAFDPIDASPSRQGPPGPRAAGHAPAGLHLQGAVPGGQRPVAAHRGRPPAARGTRCGSVLHELATAPDPRRRWAWVTGSRRTWPSTAPTTAA